MIAKILLVDTGGCYWCRMTVASILNGIRTESALLKHFCRVLDLDFLFLCLLVQKRTDITIEPYECIGTPVGESTVPEHHKSEVSLKLNRSIFHFTKMKIYIIFEVIIFRIFFHGGKNCSW